MLSILHPFQSLTYVRMDVKYHKVIYWVTLEWGRSRRAEMQQISSRLNLVLIAPAKLLREDDPRREPVM